MTPKWGENEQSKMKKIVAKFRMKKEIGRQIAVPLFRPQSTRNRRPRYLRVERWHPHLLQPLLA